MKHQPTAPLPAVPAVPARSGWFLRALFGILFAGLFLAGAAVVVLVSYTVLDLATGAAPSQAENTQESRPQAVIPLETPETAVAEVNVWDRHGPVHILLLGLDADDCGRTSGEGQRTDTMILVRVDPATKQVSMLAIPRDLYVYIDADHGSQKITTANVYGTEYEDGEPVPHSGPNLVKKVVQTNLGLPVHRYIRVDFNGFKTIVEALDGIEIDVPPSPNDPEVGLWDDNFPDGSCGTMTISFKPGKQTMDGERALQYARSRYSTSDFDRSRRQMQVLMAIRDKATGLGVILDLPDLIPAVLDTVDTDMTANEILSLARIARGIDGDKVARLQIDEQVADGDRIMIGSGEQWILRLRQDAYEQIKSQFLDPALIPTPTPPPTQAAGDGAAGAGSAPSP
jgi:LCP family protein required for cell wall assembly